jgi:competence protein ComGF|tara:strand:- start:168 stop:341 length:174 start_codon:yes stop_codon:yes gene_type:complete
MKDYWRSYIQMRFQRSQKKEWELFEHLEKVTRDQRKNLNQVAKEFLLDALQKDMKNG